MQQLEGSGTPVLYMGRTVLKGFKCLTIILHFNYIYSWNLTSILYESMFYTDVNAASYFYVCYKIILIEDDAFIS
jgi:hypothetical protein